MLVYLNVPNVVPPGPDRLAVIVKILNNVSNTAYLCSLLAIFSVLTIGIMYTRLRVIQPRRLPCKSEISCARKPPVSQRFA